MSGASALRGNIGRYDPMFSDCPLPYQDKDAFLKRKKLSGRVRIVACGFTLVACALLYRASSLSAYGYFNPPVEKRFDSVIVRGEITDRTGLPIAVKLQTKDLLIDTKALSDIQRVKRKLLTVFPEENPVLLENKLRSKKWVTVKLNLTPEEQQKVHDLAEHGFSLKDSYVRKYTQGALTAHAVGFADKYGEKGLAGIEKAENDKLLQPDETKSKIQLTLDMRVQHLAHQALQEGIAEWDAIGGAAIVMNAKNGEILALVSLPDFNPSDRPETIPENRASYVSLEPGSTFKIINAAIALETQSVNPEENFQGKPFRVEGKLITDDQGDNLPKNMYKIIEKSSNIGSAQMALRFGPGAQQILFKRFGLLDTPGVELPEKSAPVVHQAKNWRKLETAKVASGLTFTVSSLQAISAFTSMINGGYYVNPTLIPRLENEIKETNELSENAAKFLQQAKAMAQTWRETDGGREFYKKMQPIDLSKIPSPQHGERIISPQTSALLRDMARRVVENGTGRNAEVSDYAVIGKTGTANKPNPNGGYSKDKRITAFAGAFPAYDPQYSVYVMADEPQHKRDETGRIVRKAGGGSVAAPIAKKIIERLAPMMYMPPFRSAGPNSVRREIALRAAQTYEKNRHSSR